MLPCKKGTTLGSRDPPHVSQNINIIQHRIGRPEGPGDIYVYWREKKWTKLIGSSRHITVSRVSRVSSWLGRCSVASSLKFVEPEGLDRPQAGARKADSDSERSKRCLSLSKKQLRRPPEKHLCYCREFLSLNCLIYIYT